MRPATASRLARLVPAVLAIGLVLTACVTVAAPGWTFEPPPTKNSSPAASGSAAPSGSAAASASAAPSASASASSAASPSETASASASSAASPSASASAAASPSGGGAEDSLKIAAANVTFDQSTLEAKAGQPFHIVFTNNDSGVPHNVQIKAPDGSQPFKGSILTGPGSVTYDVPALAAGSYTFSCVVHPTMTGTLTVK
jgi:plastocyanin